MPCHTAMAKAASTARAMRVWPQAFDKDGNRKPEWTLGRMLQEIEAREAANGARR